MKKLPLSLWLVIIIAGIVFYACTRKDTIGKLESRQKALIVDEAKQWYEQKHKEDILTISHINKSETRLTSYTRGAFVGEPNWEHARQYTNNEGLLITLDSKNDLKYNASFRDILIVRDSAGALKEYVQRVQFDSSYLKSQTGKLGKLMHLRAYSDPKTFTGTVSIYTTSNQFIRGVKYENGVARAALLPKQKALTSTVGVNGSLLKSYMSASGGEYEDGTDDGQDLPDVIVISDPPPPPPSYDDFPPPPPADNTPPPPSDYGGGGGNAGYSAPSSTQILSQLDKKPFALFGNISCDIIKSWLSAAKFIPPKSVIDRVSSITTSITTGYNSAFIPITNDNVAWIQNINGAYSSIVNMDYFSVSVKSLPTVNGQQLSAGQFLNYIRLNINNFTDNNNFQPYNEYGINDNNLWNSSSPTGAIIAIQFPHIGGIFNDNGSVVTSYATTNMWTFTTIHEPIYGNHPVSGNRNFGYTTNSDGSYTFYTKGVDRLTNFDATILNDLFNTPFNKADELWTGLQNHIANFINQNGGKANVMTPQTYRPDWNVVKDVLDGKKPLSTLSSDCPDANFGT